MKFLLAAVGLLIFVILWQTGTAPALLDRLGLMPDHGVYFRLKVKVAYKGTPQDFDIVVGCNVNVSPNEGTSPTYEVGLIPTLFGRRMSDGAALVVRPPDACHGETTANGRVPAGFIPLMIVYDDADTLAFGTAYLTEDAYHNPLSVLTVGGATIEKATRAEFDAFRASQKNVVTPAMYFAYSSPELQKRNLERPSVWPGTTCSSYERFKLIGDELSAAKRLWPTDHPQYWQPTVEEGQTIDPLIPYNRLMQSDREPGEVHERSQFFSYGDGPTFGIVRRSGDGRIWGNPRYLTSVYPDIGPWVRLPWPTEVAAAAEQIQRDGPRVGSSVDYRDGQTRGFAYCWFGPENYPPGSWSAKDRPALLDHYYSLPGVNLVDGTPVQALEWHGPPPVIVERDEYLLHLFSTSLGSTRGDV